MTSKFAKQRTIVKSIQEDFTKKINDCSSLTEFNIVANDLKHVMHNDILELKDSQICKLNNEFTLLKNKKLFEIDPIYYRDEFLPKQIYYHHAYYSLYVEGTKLHRQLNQLNMNELDQHVRHKYKEMLGVIDTIDDIGELDKEMNFIFMPL